MIVLRRPLELMGTSIAVFAVLFLPIALALRSLFLWVEPPATLSEHALHLLHHKAAYLNVPFFLLRSAVYFAIWIAVAFALYRWSIRQDETADAALTDKMRRLGTGSLPLLGLTITFAAFDWLMSLDPTWFSTIFGVYYFAGSMVGAVALLTLFAVYGPRGEWGGLPHLHNLGKLLLTFTSFWAYIAFSQFMLIWAANLPEEVPWYLARLNRQWQGWAVLVTLAQFVLPFILLLSRSLKLRPRALGAVAMWLLLAHFLDLYWLVMPALHEVGPRPHPLDLTAFLGLGAAGLTFGLWQLRGRFAVPVGDPALAESVGYVQP
jgi:hypothetical protein